MTKVSSILITVTLFAALFVSCASTGKEQVTATNASAPAAEPTATNVPTLPINPTVEVDTDIRGLYAAINPQFVLYKDENQPITMECADPENECPIFLVMSGVPYAVAQQGVFFLDLNGNGRVDAFSQNPITPVWALSMFDETICPEEDNCTPLFDSFLDMYNGNENPYASGALLSKIQALSVFDPRVKNSDIYYALFLYYACVQENSYLDDANLGVLDTLYRSRFNSFHPLITLHLLETALNGGDQVSAMGLLSIGLQQAPDFVPFLVYDWQLEQDTAEKERKYNALKAEHPDHWIVVQI